MQQSDKIQILITAGRGPAECCWVVSQVLKTLKKETIINELETSIIDRQLGPENGSLSSVSLEISGKNVKQFISEWVGSILWIGKSMYRKFHKRKNWYIGLSIINFNKEFQLNERDLVYSTFKGSGPGGQHRNKVETAVRITHQPSGITVTATESKSQQQNRQLALKKMKEAFHQQKQNDMKNIMIDKWQEHLSLERGNPVKIFEGRDFKRRK